MIPLDSTDAGRSDSHVACSKFHFRAGFGRRSRGERAASEWRPKWWFLRRAVKSLTASPAGGVRGRRRAGTSLVNGGPCDRTGHAAGATHPA
jgi:hypothetical protein